MDLLAILLTGLFTGGLTCLAVQGGLLASTIAQREEDKLTSQAYVSGRTGVILWFLGAKLAAYTMLGFLLGYIGSFFQFSLTTQVLLQFLVAIFMVGMALNLLNVHPVFRYFVIQPPKFLTRLVRKESKSSAVFAPVLLGASTVFIPCGTTQAIMALSIASGNPVTGALILFAFTLGTSPVFFLLGYFATRLGTVFQTHFAKVAAYSIILLSVFNINNTLALTGSSFTLQNAWQTLECSVSFCDTSSVFAASAPVASATPAIYISSHGYSSENLAVKAGSQVSLKLINTDGAGCQQAFTIPSLGIQKIVPVGKTETITFTVPTDTKELAFMCSMGMYRGKIQVI